MSQLNTGADIESTNDSIHWDIIDVQANTQDQVESLTKLRMRVLEEITKPWFPDLKFLYSEETLAILPNILEELLEKERRDFYALLEKPLENVTFGDIYSTERLQYLFGLVTHLDSVHKSDTSEKIIEDFDPKYVAFSNEVFYNKDYYLLFLHLLENTNLDPDQKRIVEKNIESFRINGIDLPEETQKRVKEINLRLSELSNNFENNLVKSKKEFSYLISDFEVIKDLPQDILDNAKSSARKAGKEGYLFDSDPNSLQAIMDYCSDSKIRETFAKSRNSFASSWEFDNRPLVLETLSLRDQKAKLLWYKSFAELSLARKMADSPEVVFEIMKGITEKAKQGALENVEELKAYFGLEKLEYWDVSYYQTKLKKEKYSFDEKELKAYFEHENVLSYLFEHARNFYWVEMRKTDTVTYSADVSVYGAYKEGKLISYYLLDPFYNNMKSSWAWADNSRWRDFVDGVERVPVIINVCDFQKPEKGEILLSMDDVITIFHEFGHALHEILSESMYSDLSWFYVERDFVELPSQLNENWLYERESLKKFAKHYQTWEGVPETMLDTMDELKTFMKWLQILNQNSHALLDMSLHSTTPPETVEELDAMALGLVNDVTIFPRGEEHKSHASFTHIFSGGYAAGYYSYMWAEILEADVFARIKELGMFDRAVGESFVKTVLWQGTRKPANELFFDFMGRNLDNEAFMKRKGLA